MRTDAFSAKPSLLMSSFPANNFANGTVDCNGGERATGGGIDMPDVSVPGTNLILLDSHPQNTTGTPTGWRAKAFNQDAGNSGTGTIYVICASP